MVVNATATIALDGWPPPTIEIHALLAALIDAGHESAAGPASAFQHLNEVEISFAFDLRRGTRPDSRAQQIVLEAISQVYAGPIHVHVEVVESTRAVEPVESSPSIRPVRTVVDLTEPVDPEGSGFACAAVGCARTAQLYDVTVATAGSTDGDLQLSFPLCVRHASALGKQAVSHLRHTQES
jgi:hypothetical protein